jgi:TctA family transporter
VVVLGVVLVLAFGLTIIAALSPTSIVKGIMAGLLGLLLVDCL